MANHASSVCATDATLLGNSAGWERANDSSMSPNGSHGSNMSMPSQPKDTKLERPRRATHPTGPEDGSEGIAAVLVRS